MEEAKAEAQPILEAKDKIKEAVPSPPAQQTPVSSSMALKERLDWGEPALTILDARDRESFLDEHITGAMLLCDFENVLSEMSSDRDIYVYGENQEQVEEAANQLREAGFKTVSQIDGGLAGWKAISGSVEGRNSDVASYTPDWVPQTNK